MENQGNRGNAKTPLNKGQSLVAAFRETRINQRPTLHTQLKANRAALRQERLVRLGRQNEVPITAQLPADEAGGSLSSEAVNSEHCNAPIPTESVFAGFIDGAEQQREAPDLASLEVDSPVATQNSSLHDVNTAALAPLSTIGFGPGMTIRLSNIGIKTVADLAASDPTWLKTPLGDISHLINVEVWLQTARNACEAAA